jgi:hypothetical protein
MAHVKPTPFINSSTHIDPIGWTMSDDKKRRSLEYIEKRLKQLFSITASQKLPYHEQCEKARAWLENFLTNVRSDSRERMRLLTILTIQGEFGEPPDLAEVQVEYIIS